MPRRATSLTPAEPDATRADLAALELQVAARERDLAAFKIELQTLQSRYLSEIGTLYAELNTLDAAVAEEEIRAGIRPPPLDIDADTPDDPADGAPEPPAGCANRPAPSGNLKKIFRDVARAIHPDRAMDDRARYRRHSLMAEANRAYAEQDEDRLRLIMRTWEHSPEAVVGDDAEADALRVRRRLARLGDRLVEIDAELADLRASAIARLQRRIDETRAQGWDLFAEMLREVKRDIARASARLAKLRGSRHRVRHS
jgi:hypothetical protein